MMNIKNQNKGDASYWNCLGGGSVFISHSHNDFPKVRLIRNFLEQKGFDPLCFYMHCLNDEDEIEGLLKREIDAREWFAFMDSQNSRQSAWVKKEREYIQNKRDKNILFFELQDDSPEAIANQVMDHMTVYVCYSQLEREYGAFVSSSLKNMDFRVYDRCDDKTNGDDYFTERYQEQTRKAIEEAADHGCFLFLLTRKSINAAMMQIELKYAANCNAAIAIAILDYDVMGHSYYIRELVNSRHASCAVIDKDKIIGMRQIVSLVGQTLLEKDNRDV